MRKLSKALSIILFLHFVCVTFASCQGKKGVEPEETNPPGTSDGNGGYLFAHMTNAAYGHLFYSVSRDGLKWETLNKANEIVSDYRGHPDICQGGDGNYYMIGVRDEHSPLLTLYHSSDLITWGRKDLARSVFDVSHLGQENEAYYVGAPKMFYDEASKQYIITWHASFPGLKDVPWWEGMRTCYVLTPDFETFTKAERLFNFTGSDENMATIDAIIRKVDNTYYAIIKDERWPEKSATGKTVRVATSPNLTGPYSNPGPPISPSWREAPIIVKSMDDKSWFLYVENYGEHLYELYKANSLTGSMWSKVEFTPPVARHGFIIKVNEKQYQDIVKAYK